MLNLIVFFFFFDRSALELSFFPLACHPTDVELVNCSLEAFSHVAGVFIPMLVAFPTVLIYLYSTYLDIQFQPRNKLLMEPKTQDRKPTFLWLCSRKQRRALPALHPKEGEDLRLLLLGIYFYSAF